MAGNLIERKRLFVIVAKPTFAELEIKQVPKSRLHLSQNA